MKTFLNLPTSASRARTARRRNRRAGEPGRRLFAFHLRPAARDLSTTLELYTASLTKLAGPKYGLARCPSCDELAAVFVRHQPCGQLVCLNCAEEAA